MNIIFFFLFFLTLHHSDCATIVVDGITKWTDPTANVGDTIIFKHKDHYNLYIFRTKDTFNTCNFTQATPLSNPNSTTYTWHPSRPGYYYFSFCNGTNKPCQQGQKLAVEINPHSPLTNSPEMSVIPPEKSPPASPGGVVASSPAYPWPFQPREKARPGQTSPGPVTVFGGISPAMSPAMWGKGGTIPFINSNPAVPLPAGEVDSATIRPLPTPANHATQVLNMVGLIEGIIAACYVFMNMRVKQVARKISNVCKNVRSIAQEKIDDDSDNNVPIANIGKKKKVTFVGLSSSMGTVFATIEHQDLSKKKFIRVGSSKEKTLNVKGVKISNEGHIRKGAYAYLFQSRE